MVLALFSGLGLGRRQVKKKAGRPGGGDRQFRPRMESLEDRMTPATLAAPLDINLGVVGEGAGRTLEAVVSVAGQVVDTITPTLAPGDDVSQLLNLHLGPIDLNLLGLGVQTSEICLNLTADPAGGLLGQLLAGLGSGATLGSLVSGLGDQLNTVVGAMNGLLDDAFSSATVTGVFEDGAVSTQQSGDICNILNLEVGPLDLNLLGLGIELDDCADGPVTVDVTANPEGGLLGQILCGVAEGIDLGGLNLDDVLGRVDDLIGQLGNLAGRLDDLNAVLDQLPPQIDNLIDQLERVADSVENLADLDRLIDRVDRLIDRVERILDRL